MKKLTFNVPAMYADHHVAEVRRILLELPGVQDIYASSAFQVVEVTYDSTKTKEAAIRDALDQAGYLHPLETLVETGSPQDNRSFSRHTVAFQQLGKTVGFSQEVPTTQGLWSCPGLGPLKMED